MIFVILFLGFLLRIVHLNQSFWLDEAAQVIESSRPLIKQLDIGADFHPPLYHILLHFWMYLGTSETWIRLLSVFFGIGVIFMIYKISQLLFSKGISLFSALFAAISPYLIWYSQEARPYILFVFLSLVATYFLLLKKWRLYLIFSILTLYSLYFAPFLLIAHLVYILFFEKKFLKKMIFAQIISFIFFLPWVPFFKRQLEIGTQGNFQGWQNIVSFTPLKAIPLTFSKFIFGHGSIDNNLIYALIISPVFLIFLYNIIKLLKKREGQIISCFFSIPFIVSVFITMFIPVLAPQRLLFLLPFFIIIYTAGSLDLSKLSRTISILLFSGVSAAGIFQYYTNPYVQREQWRQAVDYIEKEGNKNSLAIFAFPEPFAPYLWYQQNIVEAIGVAPGFKVSSRDLENLSATITTKTRLYFFQYLTGLTDPSNITINYIEQSGYKLKSIKDFPGVGFIFIYDKK